MKEKIKSMKKNLNSRINKNHDNKHFNLNNDSFIDENNSLYLTHDHVLKLYNVN